MGVRDILGNVSRIRQELLNLVSNSAKSTERGFVVVSDDGKAPSDGQAQLRLSVEDTGPGIRQDQLPLHPSPSSAPLPRAPGRGVRILTVHSDTEPSRQVLDEQLTSLGVLHTSVASAHDALTALRNAQATGEPFDITIVDAAMGMDGEALGRAIRADHAMQHTALVLRGSVGDPADAERLERAGFAGYLAKPASHSQLVDTLMTALGAYRWEDPPTTTVKRESRDAPRLRLRLIR